MQMRTWNGVTNRPSDEVLGCFLLADWIRRGDYLLHRGGRKAWSGFRTWSSLSSPSVIVAINYLHRIITVANYIQRSLATQLHDLPPPAGRFFRWTRENKIISCVCWFFTTATLIDQWQWRSRGKNITPFSLISGRGGEGSGPRGNK